MDYLSAILWITFYCLGLGSVFGSSRGGAVTDAAHRTDPLGKLAGWLARDLGLPREMRVDGRVEKCPWFTKWIIIISIPVGGAGWVRSGSSIDCTSHKITFTQQRRLLWSPFLVSFRVHVSLAILFPNIYPLGLTPFFTFLANWFFYSWINFLLVDDRWFSRRGYGRKQRTRWGWPNPEGIKYN